MEWTCNIKKSQLFRSFFLSSSLVSVVDLVVVVFFDSLFVLLHSFFLFSLSRCLACFYVAYDVISVSCDMANVPAEWLNEIVFMYLSLSFI